MSSLLVMKAENRKLFHELEVEKCLVALLGSENDGTKIAASQAISAMSENSSSKDFFNTQGKKKKKILNIFWLSYSSVHGHFQSHSLPFSTCRDSTVSSAAQK
jgi:hypothetical protein